MKRHIISVSRHNLTRCSGCARHHEIDRSLSESELLSLSCEFCGQRLIGAEVAHSPARVSRSSKIAMGLLSASLAFTGCDDDEVIDQPAAGTEAGVEMTTAGDVSEMPLYGVFPAGEEAGVEMAGEEAAGTDAPVYGVFPSGEEAGVEMMTAGDDGAQPDYGVFPAGAEAGEEAGEGAGEPMEMPTAGAEG